VRALDTAIFRWINDGPESLAPIMVFFSQGNRWTGVRIFLVGLLIYFFWRKELRKPGILAMVSWPIANAACDALKFGLKGTRPCVDLPDVVLHVDKLTSYGTASAHSATMMSVAVAFWLYSRPWGIAWFVVAIMTGISRIYVGVHYPYQVVLGWLVGAVTALIVVKTWEAWVRLRAAKASAESAPDEQLSEAQ